MPSRSPDPPTPLRRFLAPLVLIVGFGLTGAGWLLAKGQFQAEEKAELNALADTLTARLSQRLTGYGDLLYGVRGLFASSRVVSRDEFRRFVAELRGMGRHPGIQAIEFARPVPRKDEARFQAALLRETGARIHPVTGPGNPQPFVVEYTEPGGANTKALGYDLATDPVRYDAVRRARESGGLALSAPHTLLVGTERESGVRFVLPVTARGATGQENFLGAASVIFRLKELMNGLPEGGSREPMRLRLRLYDMGVGSSTPGGSGTLMYDSHPGEPAGAEGLSVARNLSMGGRVWRLDVTARPGFGDFRHHSLVIWGVLVAGGLITLLAFGGARALSRAESLSRERLASERNFRRVFDASPIPLVLTRLEDSRVLMSNAVAAALFEVIPEEIGLQYGRDYWADPEDRARFVAQLREVGQVENLETRLRTRTGRVFWCLVSSRAVEVGGEAAILSSYLDISERIQAQQALKAAEARYRSLVEQSLVGIYVIQEGRIVYVNPWFQNVLGYTQAEMTERSSFLDFVAEADRDQVVGNIRKRLTGLEDGHHYTISLIRRDGDLLDVEIFGTTTLYDGKPAATGIMLDITEKRRAEQALKKSEGMLRAMFDRANEGIWLIDRNRLTIKANRALLDLLGVDEHDMLYRSIYEFVDEKGAALFREMTARSQGQGVGQRYEIELLSRDGARHHCLFNTAPLHDEDGEVIGSFAMISDITERKQAEERLRLAAGVFDTVSEGLIVTDPANRIVAVNAAFCEITGYSESEALGKTPSILNSGRHDELFYRDMWRTLAEQGRWRGEVWNRRKNGEVYPEWLSIRVVKDDAGNVANYVAVFSDIAERKAVEERIEFLAHHDVLTGLPNRALLSDRLAQAMRRAERNSEKLALLFLDLDGFKQVNDTWGHDMGDALLQQAAQRLSACVRGSDTVARLGGDEFILLLLQSGEEAAVLGVADKVLAAMARPFEVGGQVFQVSGSLGAVIYPDDGRDAQTLMRNADIAMYAAKAAGRNTCRLFQPEMVGSGILQ